jgi:hypothetical protein
MVHKIDAKLTNNKEIDLSTKSFEHCPAIKKVTPVSINNI